MNSSGCEGSSASQRPIKCTNWGGHQVSRLGHIREWNVHTFPGVNGAMTALT